MLSGGQKQKIALARALIHDKPIVKFDEATSNTDAYSEQQINGLLDTKLKEKTVIAVSYTHLAGDIFKIGNKEYVLSESHTLDIPYGEDIYNIEYPSNYKFGKKVEE